MLNFQSERKSIIICTTFNDAEFSIRKKNHRFNNNITKITYNIHLQECVTGCTIHPHCFSINYNDNEKICEFVNTTTSDLTTNMANLVKTDSWVYLDTKIKRSVSLPYKNCPTFVRLSYT